MTSRNELIRLRYLSSSLMDAGTSVNKCHLLCQICEECQLCFHPVSVDLLSRFLHCCARWCSPKASRPSRRRCRPACASIPPAKQLTWEACRSISYSRRKRAEPWSYSAVGVSRAFRSSILRRARSRRRCSRMEHSTAPTSRPTAIVSAFPAATLTYYSSTHGKTALLPWRTSSNWRRQKPQTAREQAIRRD